MWMRKHQVIVFVFIFIINFFYTGHFVEAFNGEVEVPPQDWSSLDADAMSGDPERIRQTIDAYKSYDNYMIDPKLQWRLLRAYANYHSEQEELDLDEQKWAVEAGYEFAVQINAANSDKAEIVYYYASIGIRYLYFHKFKALFLCSSLLKSFKKGQSLNPAIDDAGSNRNLGALYFMLPWPFGDKKKALDYFEEAVEIAPRRAANRLWLAKALAEEERFEEARLHIEFICAGKFDVSSQHWHTIYMREAKDLANTFPQNNKKYCP